MGSMFSKNIFVITYLLKSKNKIYLTKKLSLGQGT